MVDFDTEHYRSLVAKELAEDNEREKIDAEIQMHSEAIVLLEARRSGFKGGRMFLSESEKYLASFADSVRAELEKPTTTDGGR